MRSAIFLFFVITAHALYDPDVKKAYYILFATDVDNSTWPQGFEDYSVFIVSPQNITADHIDKIKQTVPKSKVIAYWDWQHVPIDSGCSTGHVMGDRPGRGCELYPCGPGAYTDAINKVFPSYYAVNQLFDNGTSTVVCTYPGLAHYVPFPYLNDLLVQFWAEWIADVPFDGMYLDGWVSSYIYGNYFESFFANITFDSDGDGKPNTYDELVAQYTAWAPNLSHRLRKTFGSDFILIGNSAGSLSEPSLNGLTIEMEACTDYLSCVNAIRGQKEIGHEDALGIMWLTHSEVMPPAQQCAEVTHLQQIMPWLYQGTDFFDGSHIVCNSSRTLLDIEV